MLFYDQCQFVSIKKCCKSFFKMIRGTIDRNILLQSNGMMDIKLTSMNYMILLQLLLLPKVKGPVE